MVSLMIATIMLGTFSVIFAYLAKYKHAQWGLKASFALIFFFLALRYNFGNDYGNYVDIYKNITCDEQINFNDLLHSFHEPGWLVLNWLFRDLGFFAMTALLAFINCAIYYRFIKKYVPVSYYWLAVFLYIFFPGFMLIHSTAMRQSVATMLFVFSWDYLYNKNAIRYFLCIGLASLFHFSALILLPVYLITFLNRKISIVCGGILISIFASLFIFGSSIAPYLKLVIISFSDKYDAYQDAGVVSSGFGFIYYSVLFVITLYFERIQHREIALVYKIAIISFLLIPLPLIIDMTGRLLIYFAPATMIVYPNIVSSLKQPINKITFSTMLVLLTLFQFIQFFNSETYQYYFGIYQTIFSAPQWL